MFFRFDFTVFTTIIFVTNIILALLILFLEKNDPSVTLAWILVIFMLPVAGPVLYILLAQNITRRRMYKLSPSDKDEIAKQAHFQVNNISEETLPKDKKWREMIRMNLTHANAYYTDDNNVRVFIEVSEMLSCMLDEISKAEKSINVMYFIVKNDVVGRALLNALTEKARQGVRVRLLMDALGSRQMNRYVLSDFVDAGGAVAYFFPPVLKFINLRFNYRNHRKIVVIDDEIGYTGGANIAREYIGLKKSFGNWRDTQIRIEGSGVQDMNARFIMDWKCATEEDVSLKEMFYDIPERKGNAGVQIISSGPDSVKEENKLTYLKMITSAKKNIYLQTPYFVPDHAIFESLIMAAHSGVDVRIMIPCKPDHIFVYWATYSYVGDLLDSGVRVFIYDNGFLHSKTVTADGEVASVGSTNFDRRSFRLNFEMNAVIYDKDVTETLEKAFCDDLNYCHELTAELYGRRPLSVKLREVVSRLVSDLL